MTAATLAPEPTMRAPSGRLGSARRGSTLDAAWAPLAFGLLTAALQWLVWRSFHGVPAISDEASYLLQARLFAHFRWTAPPPPIREFFEQAHVLVSPGIASKYPPGHALLLALGVMVGLPGLVPVVLTGVTAGLVFSITRRLTSAHAALLAWMLWTFAPVPEGFRPSYFSQMTTATTWVAGWWALLRWRDDPRTRWLVLLSTLAAWCAITRPLTAVAYAIPTGTAALVLVRRRRAWRAASIALVAGMAIIMILPLWSWRTLGTPLHTPYVAYDRTYLPFEHLGFGDNGGRTPTWLPTDLYRQFDSYVTVHADYRRATLPHELRERVRWIWTFTFGGASWAAIIGLFIPVGVLALGIEGLVGAACAVMLVLAYLLYAHVAIWMVYYYEAAAPLCVLAAAGVARALTLVRRPPSFERRALLAASLISLPFALATIGRIRAHKLQMTRSQSIFSSASARLPHLPAIVFVRYATNHPAQASLIDNDPDLPHAAVWKVYDRGAADDARLRALAPERHAYLYDEASGAFVDLENGAAP
jgi:hypothetical protein